MKRELKEELKQKKCYEKIKIKIYKQKKVVKRAFKNDKIMKRLTWWTKKYKWWQPPKKTKFEIQNLQK